MSAPLFVTAYQAGALISNYRFNIPPFQREYSWTSDEVDDFWDDLKSGIETNGYFLGLIILTEKDGVMSVVDGQQRLVTLVLLAKVLQDKAIKLNRDRLAELIESTFLRFTDYATDDKNFRVSFADEDDNNTFQRILEKGIMSTHSSSKLEKDNSSHQMLDGYRNLANSIEEYLGDDENAFKLLGKLTEFIKDKLYFAVFVHHNESSAYRVFEVINTRGLDLTIADLLKNYVLREASSEDREKQYYEWQRISKEMQGSTFVQYIKHVISLKCGHIPGTDLYDFISREKLIKKSPPTTTEFLSLLGSNLDIYRQIDDPQVPGPIEGEALGVFSAFNALEVVTVRPVLLALCKIDDPSHRDEGMKHFLRLVVRRMVVGSIGAGKVEREFGDVAKAIAENKEWSSIDQYLTDFDHSKETFVDQLSTRTFRNKKMLAFIRQSILQETITPKKVGQLSWIWPGNCEWENLTEENSYWAFTIGNSILINSSSKSSGSVKNWKVFRDNYLNISIEEKTSDKLRKYKKWNSKNIAEAGRVAAEMAANIWYSP